MTADLSALIARLEAAEVGSRELDGDLYWVLQRPNAERAYWNAAMGLPCKLPNDFVPSGIGQHGVISASPKFTSSLDAALALAERVLPGWGFYLRKDKDGAACGLTYPEHTLVTNGHVEHRTSLPLALCIAILRAKQGEG